MTEKELMSNKWSDTLHHLSLVADLLWECDKRGMNLKQTNKIMDWCRDIGLLESVRNNK